jgi:small subunit ribosomal protein S17
MAEKKKTPENTENADATPEAEAPETAAPEAAPEAPETAAPEAAPEAPETAAPEAAPEAPEAAADAPETIVDEVETAASEDGAGDTTADEEAKPAEAAGPSRRERLEQRRAAKRPTQAKPSTPEERAEQRREERARKAAQRRRYRARLKTKRAETRAATPAPEADHAPEHGPGRPKVRQGVVMSAKPDKTVTVRIDVTRRHRRYGKILRHSTTLHAHDERNDAREGDTVRIVECRPLSRTKRWRLTEVLERAK